MIYEITQSYFSRGLFWRVIIDDKSYRSDGLIKNLVECDDAKKLKILQNAQGVVLPDKFGTNHFKLIPVDHVTTVVADEFGMSLDLMVSKNRKPHVVTARQVAAMILYDDYICVNSVVSDQLGYSTHTTAMYCRRIATQNMAEMSEPEARRLVRILDRIYQLV